MHGSVAVHGDWDVLDRHRFAVRVYFVVCTELRMQLSDSQTSIEPSRHSVGSVKENNTETPTTITSHQQTSTIDHNSMFSCPDAVRELTGPSNNLVQLRQRNGRSLFAHPAFLSSWSGVLRNVLEDISTPQAAVDAAVEIGPVATPYITIPLDDKDAIAWEDALALMHPSRQLFKMTWDSARRLLLLAHKYDMPAITGGCLHLATPAMHQPFVHTWSASQCTHTLLYHLLYTSTPCSTR